MDSPDAVGANNEFAALGLDPRIVEALAGLGYEEPTPIQREAIPPLLAGADLVGQAATGTGKTAAFSLPLLQRVATRGERRGGPLGLVLVPTRELATQVAEAVHRYGRLLGARVQPIYGGQSFGQQARALTRGVDIVVATPGRALDHLRRETLDLSQVAMVVLDEADEMLDMGFAEDIEAILADTPEVRQTMLFSVTLPARILAIARRHLTNPVEIKVARERAAAGKAPRVRQTAYVVARAYKPAALGRILDLETPTSALVFCRTRNEVDELTETLNARGYRAEALHGGMAQEQRERVMARLRAGTVDLVVATDVAARGLDIEQLSHVVNYDVPSAPDAYVNRIGRVGRAGRAGVAITLAEPREHRLLRDLEHATKQKIDVATLPTVADLRARRLEITRATVHEALIEGDLDHVRVIVEALVDEFDVMEVALAAVKLLHQAGAAEGGDDEEIPVPTLRRERPSFGGRPTPGATRDRQSDGRKRPGPKPAKERGARGGAGMTRIVVGVGRSAGVRPQDLVGAIANETGISGREVGAIDIADRFSVVEVAEDVAAHVVATLAGCWIRGKKVTARVKE